MEPKDCNLLLVDDEEDILDLCSMVLEEEGFNLFTAVSAKEALEIWDENDIHVVISDAIMAGMTGLELFETIKTSTDKQFLFYFATGRIDVTEAELTKGGATGLISKPFRLDDIVEKVKNGIASI